MNFPVDFLEHPFHRKDLDFACGVSVMKTDSRHFWRTSCRAPARLLLAPAVEYSCTVVDVSEGGAGVTLADSLPAGASCMVSFDLVDKDAVRRINAWGRIVYSNACAGSAKAGIQFLDMDSNSRFLLRALELIS
ncbi:PilZ domain-containing protein [Noviherbaspirillum denitrificans]|uniref:PilZ domain-containing protein n=1 Tax=Noviherbaspirillum denitrificans TaxID=1968433 RepID=A0A254TEU6_9BURK|nr:PilZ domain-containing protein [Noviherbaspirillum denitrificans]OWW21189.1 hypothetical protein AYR66_18625 [Noviherbaspirillum denitrificans]